MAIDPHYIPAFSIEDVILDKDTGAPLSGGQVYFEQDNQRGVLKPVYQITGTSPNYTYLQLPNPMTLSSIGTFEDSLGNPTVPYFFPYDGDFNPEYYYVRVESADAVPQFDREAVPYIPDTGSSEIDSAFVNELSNPQFAVVNFTGQTVYSFNNASQEVVNIAPNWDIVVSCTGAGSVTVQQTKPAGSVNIISNPGTLLNITSSSLTSLVLRQRLYGSPNLWGSGYLSGTFIAKTYAGSSSILGMYYSQSNGIVVDQLITSGTLSNDGSYAAHPGSVLIPASTSTQMFPTAYVDIFFDLPLSTQIDITSIMVSFTGAVSVDSISYDQESYARQVDHLYHNAYPIVPVGAVIDFCGFSTPSHYVLCDGTAYDRQDYSLLFNAITKVETVSLTNASPTFTVVSSADYWIGMAIEGADIPASTTISNISGTTITMSNNASATASNEVRFFAAGAGDGSTTFNVPDLMDYVVAGVGGSLFGTNNNGVGAKGGAATHTLTVAEMPAHTHPGVTASLGLGTAMASGAGAGIVNNGGYNMSVASEGGGTAHSIVQQTALMKKCIRFE